MAAWNRFSKLPMSMLIRHGRTSGIIQTSIRNCSSPASQASRSTGKPGAADSAMHKPSDFERRVLVWSRQYADKGDVPAQVTVAAMKKAKDYFRIRVNILMIIGTVFGCAVMIKIGKNLRYSGESLRKIDEEWQAGLKEKAHAEEEAKSST